MNKFISSRAFKYIKNFARYGTVKSTKEKNLDLSGVYPPMVTNFDNVGNIDFKKLSNNFSKWETVPFRGFVVMGTTGEYVLMSHEEKIDLVKYVINIVPSNKLIIAGTGCESTKETIELTNQVASFGVSAALVVNPCYNKGRMSEDVLFDHYSNVAESSKIPIIIYNVPANTGIDMTPTLILKLADHPNIIGMKESGGDITKIGYIVHKTKNKNFQVLAGSAGFLYPALCVGCVGGIVALANSLGKSVCKLYQYTVEGKHKEACELQHRLIGPNLCVTKWFGIPGVKASMDFMKFDGGLCRAPLKALSSKELDIVKDEFETNGFN